MIGVTRWRTPRVLGVGLITAVLLGLGVGLPSAVGTPAQSSLDERVESLDVVAVVKENGDVDVTENILWNFGGYQKHGIFRYIPEKSLWTGTRPKGSPDWEELRRVTHIDWKSVRSATAPDAVDISSEKSGGNVLSVAKVGDANIFVTGKHLYTLKYTIKKAVSQDVLFIGLTGFGWTVPIERVNFSLTAPVNDTSSGIRCELRGENDENCRVRVVGDVITASTTGLGNELFVPLRPGNYAPVELEPVQTLRRAFDPGRGAGPLAGLASLVGVAGAILTGKKGRDRVFASGAALGEKGAPERQRRLGERIASPVEFEPPEGIRPGLVEAARTGEASQRSVTAMVADLAVRGALSIETFDEQGTSFRMTRRERARDGRDLVLTQNETQLLRVLFGNGDSVTSDDLQNDERLASEMQSLRHDLVNETVSRDWWEANPARVRAAWVGKGTAALIGATGLTIFLALKTRFALVGLAGILFALGILAFASTMPVKTATGSRISARLKGFELLFDAGEGDRLKLAERLRADKDLFSNYLPYALAFGNVDRWVKTFGAMGIASVATPWISGPGFNGGYGMPMGGGVFNDRSFSQAMQGFDRSLNSSIAAGAAAAAAQAAAQRSSSSGGGGGGGFSGGGSSGGGGGGSW